MAITPTSAATRVAMAPKALLEAARATIGPNWSQIVSRLRSGMNPAELVGIENLCLQLAGFKNGVTAQATAEEKAAIRGYAPTAQFMLGIFALAKSDKRMAYGSFMNAGDFLGISAAAMIAALSGANDTRKAAEIVAQAQPEIWKNLTEALTPPIVSPRPPVLPVKKEVQSGSPSAQRKIRELLEELLAARDEIQRLQGLVIKPLDFSAAWEKLAGEKDRISDPDIRDIFYIAPPGERGVLVPDEEIMERRAHAIKVVLNLWREGRMSTSTAIAERYEMTGTVVGKSRVFPEGHNSAVKWAQAFLIWLERGKPAL